MKAINVLVAEKVMGWKVYSTNNAGLVLMDEAMARDWGTGVGLATQAELDAKKYIKTTYVPEYSTSIEAAWEVVEKMGTLGFSYCLAEQADLTHRAYFRDRKAPMVEASEVWCDGKIIHKSDDDPHGFAHKDKSAPLAICIAALRAVGTPEQEITAAMEGGGE